MCMCIGVHVYRGIYVNVYICVCGDQRSMSGVCFPLYFGKDRVSLIQPEWQASKQLPSLPPQHCCLAFMQVLKN